jgi:hypothetical protein
MRTPLWFILAPGFASATAQDWDFDSAPRSPRKESFRNIRPLRRPTSPAPNSSPKTAICRPPSRTGARPNGWTRETPRSQIRFGAYLHTGNAAESAEQFARAAELASDDTAYHFNLANMEFMLRHDLAAAWKHVLALSSQRDFAYLQLTRISLKRGNASAARRCLAKLTDTRTASLKRKLLAEADLLWRSFSVRLHLDRIEINRNGIAPP